MTDRRPVVGRVFRLESYLLDQELDDTVDGIVDQLEIPKYSEELKTVLKMFFFSSYINSRATAGMKVYNLNYCDQAQSIPARQKLIALTAIRLTTSYIVKRFQTFERLIQSSSVRSLNLPWLSLDSFVLLCKSLGIINFFMFLKNGLYLTLPERMLGLVAVVSDEGYPRNNQLNRVQMDFMYRDVIWRATAEFMSAVIPMINVEQIRNKVSRLTGMTPSMSSDMKLSDKFRIEATRCAICLEQPFNPHIIGCMHVFCYYCLQTKYLADPSNGYACKLCKFRTEDELAIQRYRILIRKELT